MTANRKAVNITKRFSISLNLRLLESIEIPGNPVYVVRTSHTNVAR